VLKEAATSNISQALRQVVTLVGGMAYLFALSWKLTLLMLAVVPSVAIGARMYGKRVKAISKATQQALAEATEVAEEGMSNVRTVRAFDGEARQRELYGTKIEETLRMGVRSSLASGVFQGALTGITTLSFLAVVYYGAGRG
jgi:ABC-type multidrug transport system fused ATPase/permease subunit